MTALLHILRAGPVCTLQDAGRTGWLRYGVTPAGPMDWIAHATANLMAGNLPSSAAIEIGPGGLHVTAKDGPLRIGLSARGFIVKRGVNPLPTQVALTLWPGDRLAVDPGPFGLWAYLTLAGGFAEPAVMGSLSTHLRSGIGPFGGRALHAGQDIACPPNSVPDQPDLAVISSQPKDSGPIRFVAGPQQDCFSPQARTSFCAATFVVSAQSDRMGYRLVGPPVAHLYGHDIVSDGIAMGAIQVPGDGLPIVLMADRQPTGGYPKIGTIIRADLPRLAQTRPGQSLRFVAVSVDQAVAALRMSIPSIEAMTANLRRIGAVARGPQT